MGRNVGKVGYVSEKQHVAVRKMGFSDKLFGVLFFSLYLCGHDHKGRDAV